MSAQVIHEPVKEYKTVGYRWSLSVTRSKYIPSEKAAYKGDKVETTVGAGGNTETLEQMWKELYHAASNLGVKVNE